MKYATLPLYIRFGEIPADGKSKIHASDAVVGVESGVSCWRAIEADGCYYPVLPEDANKNAITDYFHMLLNGNQKVYLVTGTETRFEGTDREPLLTDVVIIKEITGFYSRFNNDMKEADENGRIC